MESSGGNLDFARRKLWPIASVLVLSAVVITAACLGFFFVFHPDGVTEHVILTIRGSTSLGDDLIPKLSEAFLRDDLGAEDTGIKVERRDRKGRPVLHVWGKIPGRRGLQVIEIYASGSGAAFECLAAKDSRNACDIGMASRPIDESDRQMYPAIKDLDDDSSEHVVALDAIAVIVNPNNPVSELSISQLRAIYTRQITNWKDVGGNDTAIDLYGRDSNSGTFEMFTEKVIGKDAGSGSQNPVIPPDHQISDSSRIVDAVMRVPNAIGYVSSSMVRGSKALAISDGSGAAIFPTQLPIVTEDYPICRRLLLYDWESPGSVKDAFVRYVVYKPGQTLVGQTPFIELTPSLFRVAPDATASAAYEEIASKYSRIGLSFHFSSEQSETQTKPSGDLDNLARVNVLRLRTFLAQHNGTGDDILLIGFADESEAAKHNQVARERAESVAKSLRAVGVIVPSQNIRDFGAQMPVATNHSPEGRSKNRRVEVWVRNELH